MPVIAIINPKNGSGISPDPNYLAGVQKLQSEGVLVLGYMHTNYAARNSTDVIAEIDNYKNWYNVNGAFFDEMSNVADNEGYYSNLTRYARSAGLTMTVGNPGHDTLPSYVGTVDNIVIHDNSGLPPDSLLGGWHTDYAKSNFSILAYGVDSLDRSYVGYASNYVQYMYMTNDTLPNPWDSLPPYFADLVAFQPASVSLTVRTVDLYGNPVPQLYIAVQLNGNLLKSGFSPASLALSSDQTYTIIANEFGDYAFDHWSDNGRTLMYRDISMSTDTELTAVYRNISDPVAGEISTISVSTTDSSGYPVTGYYVSLWQNGTFVKDGFSPTSFAVNNFQTYHVAVADYGTYVFDHWSDGTLARFHEVNTGNNTTTDLVAVYRQTS